MANNLNRLCLIGRLGKDAELAETKTGKRYMKFSLATNRSRGPSGEETDWHNVIVWNEKLVEHLHPYLTKGKQIYVEGTATTYKKSEEAIIPMVEVGFGHHLELLGSKNDAPSEVPDKPSKGGSVLDGPPTRPNDDDGGVPF